MTHRMTETAMASPNAEPSRRRISPPKSLPGTRALTGALFVTLAAVGTFVAGSSNDDGAVRPLVVARRDVVEGRLLTAADVQTIDAPRDYPAGTSFEQPDDVVGRTAVGPIARGDVIQASAVTGDRPTGRREVLLRLPLAQVALSRLRAGERVDVFATGDGRTLAVLTAGEVLEVVSGGTDSLIGEREIGLVVAVDTPQAVSDLVHAARTSELTVVRSTSADAGAG